MPCPSLLAARCSSHALGTQTQLANHLRLACFVQILRRIVTLFRIACRLVAVLVHDLFRLRIVGQIVIDVRVQKAVVVLV